MNRTLYLIGCTVEVHAVLLCAKMHPSLRPQAPQFITYKHLCRKCWLSISFLQVYSEVPQWTSGYLKIILCVYLSVLERQLWTLEVKPQKALPVTCFFPLSW